MCISSSNNRAPSICRSWGVGGRERVFALCREEVPEKTSLLRVHKSRSKRREASEVAACGWTPLKVLLGDAQSLGKNKFGLLFLEVIVKK